MTHHRSGIMWGLTQSTYKYDSCVLPGGCWILGTEVLLLSHRSPFPSAQTSSPQSEWRPKAALEAQVTQGSTGSPDDHWSIVCRDAGFEAPAHISAGFLSAVYSKRTTRILQWFAELWHVLASWRICMPGKTGLEAISFLLHFFLTVLCSVNK